MIVKLLTEHHLACLSLKGGCRGSSESTHVKMPHCWKSCATAHLSLRSLSIFECPFTHVFLYVFSVFLVEPEGKDVQKCLTAGKIWTSY